MFFTCNWPSPCVTFLAGSVTQPDRHHSLMSINAGGINSYSPATTLQTKESWLSDIKLLQPRICSAFFFIYQVSHKTGRQRSQRSKILAQLLDWQESLNIARLPLAAPPQGSHSCSTLLCGAPAKQVAASLRAGNKWLFELNLCNGNCFHYKQKWNLSKQLILGSQSPHVFITYTDIALAFPLSQSGQWFLCS